MKWQAERDRLLRAAGFTDLEDANGNIEPIARSHGAIDPERTARGYYADLEEYYRRAGQFLHEHAFRNAAERRTWELHAEGASVTRTWRTMRREGHRVYRPTVGRVIARLRSQMLGETRRPRGRPVEKDSLRSEALGIMALRLDRSSALAMDHLRAVLKVKAASTSEVIRRALVIAARQYGLP